MEGSGSGNLTYHSEISGDTTDKPEKHVSIIIVTAKFEQGASQPQVIWSIWGIGKYVKNAEYWQGT